MGFHSLKSLFLTIIFLISLISLPVNPLKLEADGGYSVSLAIDDGTTEPRDYDVFKKSIVDAFNELSNLMWTATGNNFFIKKLDIIIPETWNLPTDPPPNPIELKTYQNSDIRVTPNTFSFRVQNRNQCGRGGEFMEIPLSYFRPGSEFGTTYGKSLLHEWARYRWGIWEEHGHPADYRFPYFYKEDLAGSDWKTTGCSDVPLEGTIVDTSGEDGTCTMNDFLYAPEYYCRFEPDLADGANTALTSLMQFPWIKSVVNFCDSSNHNVKSPNRHNMFCGYRSTTEAIQDSDDRLIVTSPQKTAAVAVTISRSTSRPVLYLLIDDGLHQIPAEKYILVKAGLKDLLDGRIHPNTSIAIELFYPNDPNKWPAMPDEKWTTIAENKDKFESYINKLEPEENQVIRSFDKAIRKAVNEIYTANPVTGGVLIVLKVGAQVSYGGLEVEQELVSFVKGRPVRIFAIEIQENVLTPRIHLEAVAKGSGGGHLKLEKNSDFAADMNGFINSVVDVFSNPAVPITNVDFVAYKEIDVTPNTVIELPVLDENILPIRIILTTKAVLHVANITLTDSNNNPIDDVTFKTGKEWQEGSSTSRNTLTGVLEKYNQSSLTLKYLCAESAANCKGHLIIYGEDAVQTGVEVKVTTSARDSALNLAPNIGQSELNKQFPLSIFAEITQRGGALRGLDAVATVRVGTKSELVVLRDNGQPPDLFQDDGIYSGVLVPLTTNGDYRVSVRFTYRHEPEEEEVQYSVRLLPVDQTELTCGNEGYCRANAVVPNGTIVRTWDLLDPVKVSNSPSTFQPVPSPILDLGYFTSDDFMVTLEWKAPYVIGESAVEPVESYEICRAADPKDILDNIATCVQVPANPLLPGEKESLEEKQQDATQYYAIRSIYNGRKSLLSNIIGVFTEQSPATTTTTPRPTTTRRTTTTERSTPGTEAPPLEVSKGYNIVVAVDDESGKLNATFTEILKEKISELSKEMFRASQRRFYIANADIVVPRSWDIVNETNAPIWEETSHSLRTADIRISTKLETPRVENPNPCGMPGSFMELPVSFFDSATSPYGEPWKAFLHQWARYRWGVWEEHGYIGSQRFPYFHKNPIDDVWEATGCSDSMLGDITDSEDQTCAIDPETGPGDECRFRPLPTTTSPTSLMYLHWVGSVKDFCDDVTHDIAPPTKQNLFCRHRSVTEIIHRSLDLSPDDEFHDTVPLTTYNFRKLSPKPMFYMLLDDGISPVPEDMFGFLRNYLVQLVDKRVPKDNVFGIGRYPSEEEEEEGPYVQDLIELTAAGTKNVTALIGNLEMYPSKKIPFRDFGVALHETIRKLLKYKLEAGGVILLVKTGVEPNTFDKVSYEEEIVALLKENNIKIFALELRTSALRPATHLQYLVRESGGLHLTLNNTGTIPTIEDSFSRSLEAELDKEFIETPKKFRVMYKGPIQPEGLKMKVAARDYSFVHISLSTKSKTIDKASVYVQLERRNFTIHSKSEWAIKDEANNRETFYGYRTSDNLGPSADFSISYACQTNVTDCDGFLVIEGQLREEIKENPDAFTILPTTSVSGLNNFLDLGQNRLSTIPFAVFVKVEENGNPVRGIEKVEATFYFRDKSEFWTVALYDNGYGTPDTFKNDGIYSGSFIPPTDGIYNMFVTVTHTIYTDPPIPGSQVNTVQDHPLVDVDNVGGLLLPVDQEDMGCEIGQCNAKRPTQNFVRVVDYAESILVQNSHYWAGFVEPTIILDLNPWPIDDYKISLRWRSPFSIGEEEEVQADYFELGVSETNAEDLKEDKFDEIKDKITIQADKLPGEIQEYIFTGKPDTGYFFAIRSCLRVFSHCSKPSNIVGTRSREFVLPTSPPPSTTEEPLPTTTKPITTTTVKASNPTTRTTIRSSTTTSAPPITTTEYIKHWYEKTEGIITLSAFGGAILLLAMAALLYVFLKNRKGTPEMKRNLILE